MQCSSLSGYDPRNPDPSREPATGAECRVLRAQEQRIGTGATPTLAAWFLQRNVDELRCHATQVTPSEKSWLSPEVFWRVRKNVLKNKADLPKRQLERVIDLAQNALGKCKYAMRGLRVE